MSYMMIAEQRMMSFEDQKKYFINAFEKSGIKVTLFGNITDGVIDSCVTDSDRKKHHLRWLPSFNKKAMFETIGYDPSDKLESFRDGRLVFILMRAEKSQA